MEDKQAQAFNAHQDWWEKANAELWRRADGSADDALRMRLRACAASAWGAGVEWEKVRSRKEEGCR